MDTCWELKIIKNIIYYAKANDFASREVEVKVYG